MRLFLLPISTRRTLLYAHRLGVTTTANERSYVDRGAAWAARKWADWEAKDAGWQRRVVDGGNHLFRRIPYEEWGLKSVPPLSSRRRDDELRGRDKVELVFPPSVVPAHKAETVLRTLATERQALHRQRLIWCIVGMPISAPFALVPVIPNIPFFYLLYRAWSHYRAISGGKHAQWLLENNLILQSPSKEVDAVYTKPGSVLEETDGKERMLLTQDHIPELARTLDIPALQLELERAIWQVERSLLKAQGKKPEEVSTGGSTTTTQAEEKKKE
ncbi:hypothetical protein S40293_02034 [Stachybotrys chartarum IBT 40293]|nr:hypothetical protein S40293_02034 [Stachybotrys chartarum IBT 40293]